MSTLTRPQGGGILPPQTLKSLDEFMDLLNQGSNSAGSNSISNSMVHILLVGTNEGVPLSRSYGSAIASTNTNTSTSTNTNANHTDGNHSEYLHLSDELISSVETIWATLPSSMQPSNRATMMNAAQSLPTHFKDTTISSSSSSPASAASPVSSSPHPLLKHIGLGSEVQSTVAYYESCILVHVHFAPLVITFIASHDANIGKIQQNIGRLKEILEPVQKTLVEIMIQTNKF